MQGPQEVTSPDSTSSAQGASLVESQPPGQGPRGLTFPCSHRPKSVLVKRTYCKRADTLTGDLTQVENEATPPHPTLWAQSITV